MMLFCLFMIFWYDIENKWVWGGGCRKNIFLNKSVFWEDIVKG